MTTRAGEKKAKSARMIHCIGPTDQAKGFGPAAWLRSLGCALPQPSVDQPHLKVHLHLRSAESISHRSQMASFASRAFVTKEAISGG